MYSNIKQLFLLSMLFLVACADDPTPPSFSEGDIALNNRGVAMMGRFDYPAATQVFEDLVERHPDWHEVRTNLAIAYKNRQREGDGEIALEQLALVLMEEPSNPRANYVAGVLELYLGRVAPASAYFKAAINGDPEDAYAHYYLGQCQLRSGDQAAALGSYQKAIELDPYLRSAYYSAAQVLRRLGRAEEANRQLAVFQRFENNPSARLAEFKYTRMGPKSLAKVLGNESRAEQPIAIPEGPLFSSKRAVADLTGVSKINHISTVDFNRDGRQDLFLSSEAEGNNRLLLAAQNGTFVESGNYPWKDVTGINAVAWGDIDNNGRVDVYLCRSGANQLWLQSETGGWKQAGPDAMVGDAANDCVDATMVDADHDGDLDLLIANRGAGDNLLNNNRDGTFRSLAEKLGDAVLPTNTRHLITTDIDGDNDVDLIFVKQQAPHLVLLNDRLWNYVVSPDYAPIVNAQMTSLATVDLDADGQVELLSVDNSGGITRWQRLVSGQWQGTQIHRSILATQAAAELVPLDLNGNGRAEILLLADGGFEVVSVSADGNSGELMSEAFTGGMPVPVTRSVQGSSLIAVEGEAGGSRLVEWSAGAGRLPFVTLEFTGKHDAAETMRSNHSGIGTQVSVRTGERWSRTDTHKHSSLRGYSLQAVSVGLGGRQKADFVAIDWSDGVYQTELDVEIGSPKLIAEEQRQLGSCPVLFAWNGNKYSFVTDILGVAAQGFLVEPGSILPPRPWERVSFAPGSLVNRDGYISFKVTEPMEENSYIDEMLLESYDIPEDWEIVLDERMGTGAPEVTGDTLFYQKSISPVRAYDSAGKDVYESILKHDQIAMEPGNIDRQYIGLLKEPESITIEFDQPLGEMIDRPSMVPVLVAESWVELPYSQTHFAAWQAGKQYGSVSLEERDTKGEWKMVHPEFGIPGGMPRTISLPLAAVSADTRALRLSWNREIYWDRIRVVYAEQAPTEMTSQTLSPESATVSKSGFYKRVNHPQRRPEYIYQQAATFADVEYPTGFYTNIGAMTELVENADDALAIIGPGEEIHVDFAVPDPPPAGMRRWYVLQTKGWAKDKDMYTYQGNQVGPLPRAHPSANSQTREALHQKYNTRFQSGR